MLDIEHSTEKRLRGDDMTTQISIEAQVGELRGQIEGLKSRMDDMHRLMMVLITIAGGGLVTALISLVLQLLR